MRWWILPAAVAAFFLGAGIAEGEPAKGETSRELARRQKLLFKDLTKIERAVVGIKEIREMRATGKYVLNSSERKLEKTSRKDFHIFMERFRNDTLEVLEIYDLLLKTQDYVDPIKRAFGKSLREVVNVDWDEVPMEDVVAEIIEGYGVQINLSGELNHRKTMSLRGELSLMSILLYIENVWDAEIATRKGKLWFVPVVAAPAEDAGED